MTSSLGQETSRSDSASHYSSGWNRERTPKGASRMIGIMSRKFIFCLAAFLAMLCASHMAYAQNFTLTASSSSGNASATTTSGGSITVGVGEVVSFSVTASGLGTSGTSGTLTCSGGSGYSKSGNGVGENTYGSWNWTPTSTGTYDASCSYSGYYVHESTQSIVITVTAPPTITSLSPTSGAVGASVTITGTNFGATQSTNTVKFNGTAATSITSWSNASIMAVVPTGASTGNVVVTTIGGWSNGVAFTVLPTPSLSVATSGTPSTYGGSVTFTATISSGPTGAVTFYSNGTAIGTGTISGPTAIFTTSTLAAGTHSITASWPGNSSYGPVTSAVVSQTVNKAVLTVTANNASRAYGAANPAFTSTYSGFLNGDTVSVLTGAPIITTTATATSPVGSYPISPTIGSLTATNYSFTFVNGTLTIGQAVLTVTANNASRAYGAANPTFTPTYSGFLNGDTTSVLTGAPSLTTTATITSPVGSYPISPTIGSLTATNYSFTFVNGTLTVGQAVLTVTANASRVYGAANPTFTPTYSGFLNGDTTSVLGGSPSLTTTATVTSAVGSYTITVTVGSLTATNYSFTSVNGTLTVSKAVLTVTANNASRAYGAANPTFTPTYSGFLNGDTASVLTGAPVITTTATATSPVGSYPISPTIGTLTAANYSFTFVNGTLTVGTATPIITWPTPAPITYGTPLTTTQLNATVVGNLLGNLTYIPTAGTVLMTGTQTLSVVFTPTDSTDYTKASSSVSLTVNKATTPPITWTIPASGIPYGTPLSSLQLYANTGGVAGTFTYSSPSGPFTSFNTVGSVTNLTYTFTPSDRTGYTSPSTGLVPAFNVVAATPVITWNEQTAPFNGGTALSGQQLNAAVYSNLPGAVGGQLLGTYLYSYIPLTVPPSKVSVQLATDITSASGTGIQNLISVTPGITLAPGPQTLFVTFTPASSSCSPTNCNTAKAWVILNVTKQANPTITWAAPASITDTTPLSATQLDAVASVAGAFVYTLDSGAAIANSVQPVAGALGTLTVGTPTLPAGHQILTATFTPTDTADYATVSATVAITVTGSKYDTGTVTLTIGGNAISTYAYGQSDTPSTIAEQIASRASSSAAVSVSAVDDALYIQANTSATTANATDYSYSLTISNAGSQYASLFPEASFQASPPSGYLDGGAAQNSPGQVPVYSYCVPELSNNYCNLPNQSNGYDPVGNLLTYTDNSANGPIMGSWTFTYDTLNRLTTATAAANAPAPYANNIGRWSYDDFGNRLSQSISTTPCANNPPLTSWAH